MTTLRTLIDQLEELAGEYGDDIEVRVAYQPTYPLAGDVRGVSVIDPAEADEVDNWLTADVGRGEEDDDFDHDGDVSSPPVAWIAVDAFDSYSGVNPYAPREAFENVGMGSGF